MDEQTKRCFLRDTSGVVGRVAVAFDDGDAIAQHVDDIDRRCADRASTVVGFLNRNVGIVIGVVVVRPVASLHVRVSRYKSRHIMVVRIEMVFAIVGPRRSVFERFIPDKRPDVRDGVGRVGNEFVGNSADGLVPFVAVAEGRGSQHGDDKGKENNADDPATDVWFSFQSGSVQSK